MIIKVLILISKQKLLDSTEEFHLQILMKHKMLNTKQELKLK